MLETAIMFSIFKVEILDVANLSYYFHIHLKFYLYL
jgi:hypothetical protein